METPSLGSSNSSSPLSSYHGSGYEFQSGITESGGSGQESISERRRSEQHETGHHPSSVLSRTESAVSHHSTHSGSYLTDKERRVYAVHGSESHSTEESGPGRLVGSQGSLRFSNVPPARTVLTHSEVHGPASMNLEAKNCSTEESRAGDTGRMVGSQGSLRFSSVSPARTVLTHSEIHGPPSMNLPIEQQPSTRPPSDVHPGPDVPPYTHAHREETYSQPIEPTGGEHRTSSGNPVHQASSQSNIAVENFRDPEPRNYIYPQHQPFLSTNSDRFVSGLRSSSFGSSLGSSFLVTGTSYYPSGTSLATSNLLSSESSGPESSYQGSTMPSQPSFEPSLSSVEEKQSEEEREEEEEEAWVKRPKLAKSASSTKQRKSSSSAEEHKEQTKSWTSSLLGLPKKVVSGVWSTFSGGTQEKKEEDSDSSFESCKDDEGSSSD